MQIKDESIWVLPGSIDGSRNKFSFSSFAIAFDSGMEVNVSAVNGVNKSSIHVINHRLAEEQHLKRAEINRQQQQDLNSGK